MAVRTRVGRCAVEAIGRSHLIQWESLAGAAEAPGKKLPVAVEQSGEWVARGR